MNRNKKLFETETHSHKEKDSQQKILNDKDMINEKIQTEQEGNRTVLSNQDANSTKVMKRET